MSILPYPARSHRPRFVVGAAIGAGAVARAAQQGGADFLLVLTAGHFRIRGVPSVACMLPLGSANEMAFKLVEEEIGPICKVPYFIGLSAMDVNGGAILGHGSGGIVLSRAA